MILCLLLKAKLRFLHFLFFFFLYRSHMKEPESTKLSYIYVALCRFLPWIVNAVMKP